jgi:hypothetical protein
MNPELPFPESAGDRYAVGSYSLISGDHRTADPVQLGSKLCRRSTATSSRGGRAASFGAEELACSTIHLARRAENKVDVIRRVTGPPLTACRAVIAAREPGQMTRWVPYL